MTSTTSPPSLFDSISAWQISSSEHIKGAALFLLNNYTNVLMFLVLMAVGFWKNKKARVRWPVAFPVFCPFFPFYFASLCHCPLCIVLRFMQTNTAASQACSRLFFRLVTKLEQSWYRRRIGVDTFIQDEAAKIPQHAALPAPDFPTIVELEKFDLRTAKPINLRPFKPQYHLTMGKDPLPSPIHFTPHASELNRLKPTTQPSPPSTPTTSS
jgi:hypothetical protein